MKRLISTFVGMFLILVLTSPGQSDPPQIGLSDAAKMNQAAQSLQPDLAVVAAAWSHPIREGDRVGYGSILNIVLKNLGAMTGAPCEIQFTCPGCPPAVNGKRMISPIPPNGKMNVVWPNASNDLWQAKTYAIILMLDPAHKIADRDRNNNFKNITFTVSPKNSLLISKDNKPLTPVPANPFGQTGRRRVQVDITTSAEGSPQVGKRIVQVDIAGTVWGNAQTGRRIVDVDIAGAVPIPKNTGKRIVAVDITIIP